MLPVLASFGPVTITSFGVFTVSAFLASLYVVWRLAIIYDFDKEKILDLFIFTSLIGLIGARISFVLVHLSEFRSAVDMISIMRFPGFYFWGGFYSAIVFLIIALRRRQTSFWQVTDIAVVGLVAALSIGSIGCLLSSCQYGFPTTLPFGVYQSGLIDHRFPIQIFMAVLFLAAYFYLWRQSLKFHLTGVITAKSLIWISIIIFLTDFYRADISHNLLYIFSFSQLIAVLTLILGITGYCLITKTSPVTIVSRFISKFTNPRKRQKTLDSLTDDLTEIPTQLSRTQNKLFRRFNIRRTPKDL
jgi:phosphatidylglycerol:prolipoprotein diacylglycerol transferase